MVKYQAFLNAVTIITRSSEVQKGIVKDEFNNLVAKLKGKARSIQIRTGNRTKIGVLLWNHPKILRRDDFAISIFLDRKKTLEPSIGTGLINLEQLAAKYPGLKIKELGVFERTRTFYKALRKQDKGYKKIGDLQTGSKNPLNIAMILYRDENEVKEVFNDFKKDTGNGELIINRATIDYYTNTYKNYFARLLSKGQINNSEYTELINNLSKPQNPELVWDTIGFIKDKEIGYVGFERNNTPLIHALLWHHEQEGYDDYWVIIMIKNAKIGTEINEKSIETIATRTGIPLLKWGAFEIAVQGEKSIRGKIRKASELFANAVYYLRSITIQGLLKDKKLDSKKVKEQIKEIFDKEKVAEVFKKDEIIEDRVKDLVKEYKKLNKEELEQELKRVKEYIQKELNINYYELKTSI